MIVIICTVTTMKQKTYCCRGNLSERREEAVGDAVGQSTCFNKMDIDGQIKKEAKVIAERQVELLVGAAILKVRMSHVHVITSTQLQEEIHRAKEPEVGKTKMTNTSI